MSADEACEVILSVLGRRNDIISFPMADGGEGTAQAIATQAPGWEKIAEGIFLDKTNAVAAMDSSAAIGYTPEMLALAPMKRSSRNLGVWLNRLCLDYGANRIYLGIGGTAVCDGGKGLLQILNPGVDWRRVIIGLADVEVPLLPKEPAGPSAMMFCRQKGYTAHDEGELKIRLKEFIAANATPTSPFAGAGGGVGYALADVLGCECHLGAEWLLNRLDIPWEKLEFVITGEGRVDCQTSRGKTVNSLARMAEKHAVETVCFAGCVEDGVTTRPNLSIIDTSRFYPELPLNSATARLRLRKAVESWYESVNRHPL